MHFNQLKYSAHDLLFARRRLSVGAALALLLLTACSSATLAKSDWIEGDQDEVKLPDRQVQQLKNQARGVWRPDAENEGSGSDSSGAAPQRLQRGFQPAGNQADDATEKQLRQPTFNEDNLDASGHPVNLDDLDNRPVPVQKQTIEAGGRNVIQGGVSSANFRTANTINRGTDNRANAIIRQAPNLGQPHDVTVQPGTFKGFLDRVHSGEASAFGKTTLVEVRGRWDDCGHVIHSFGLPSTRISASALPKADLSKTKIMVVNCGAEFDGEAIGVVRDFVSHGGFLMTTDWALDSCLQKAFPGFVAWNSGYTSANTVDAVVVDHDPDLTKGLPSVAHWRLEDKSQMVQVVRPMAVQVLVRSPHLMREDPSQLGILALTFPYGDGQVLHIVGHFDNNTDRASNLALHDPAPIIGIALRQALAANFIMAAGRDGGLQGPDSAPPDQ